MALVVTCGCEHPISLSHLLLLSTSSCLELEDLQDLHPTVIRLSVINQAQSINHNQLLYSLSFVASYDS
jgi:hypothetical protein